MIIDSFLSVVAGFLEWGVSLLPSSSGLPSFLTSGLTNIISYVKGVSWIFPIEHLFIVSLLTLAMHKAELIWSGFNWLIKKIPGMN